MVMVKLAGDIVEIEGKVGGDVWRSDVCGSHIQKEPRRIGRHPSVYQEKRRRAFRFLVNISRRCLTIELVAYWQDYANKHPRINSKGKVIKLTWFQKFISHNINKVVNEEDIDLLPPDYVLIGTVPESCEQYL